MIAKGSPVEDHINARACQALGEWETL
jgi:hypothetical protein